MVGNFAYRSNSRSIEWLLVEWQARILLIEWQLVEWQIQETQRLERVRGIWEEPLHQHRVVSLVRSLLEDRDRG